MIKRNAIDFLRVFLFAGVLLALSSLFYSYKNFALETVLLFVVLGLGLVFRPAKVLAVLFSFFYFLMFIVFNYNYAFILGLCLVVGLLIYDVIQDRLNVHPWAYVLIPLFILLHVVWFNVLPFGFAATYTLDVGSENDMDPTQDIYLVDRNGVLGPRVCVEGECYREFVKDGEVEVVFFDVNISKEITLEYDSNSTYRIGEGELFYDQSWQNWSIINKINSDYIYVKNKSLFQECTEECPRDVNQFLLNVSTGKEHILDFSLIDNLTNPSSNDFENFKNNISNHPSFSSESNVINTSFRGSFLLESLLEKNSTISLFKRDLNNYEGAENISLEIFSEHNNYSMIFEIPDDGVTNISEPEEWKEFDFNIKNNNSGIFMMIINAKNNFGADYEIKNITVNSNKVNILNEIYVRDTATLWFEEDTKSIDLIYWHNITQEIIIGNSSQNLTYDENLRNTKIMIDLLDGELIQFSKGNIRIFSDRIGFWNDSFYTHEIEPEIIISKSSNLSKMNSMKLELQENGLTTIEGKQGSKIYSIEIVNGR